MIKIDDTQKLIGTFINESVSYLDRMAVNIIDPLHSLFPYIISLWAVIAGYRLIFNHTDFVKLGQDVFWIILSSVILFTGGAEFIKETFQLYLTLLRGGANMAFAIFDDTPRDISDLPLMFAYITQNFLKIVEYAEQIFMSGSTLNWFPFFYGLAFGLPFLFLFYLTFSQIVISIFRLLILSSLAPLLVFAGSFQWSRPMMVAGIKTVISSVLVLFSTMCAVALVLKLGGTIFIDDKPLRPEQVSLDNPKFLLMMVIGWAGNAFVFEAVGIANSISATALTNTSAGILSGGLTGVTIGAAKKTRDAAMGGTKKLMDKIKSTRGV